MKKHNKGGILTLLLEIVGILILIVGAYLYLRTNTVVLDDIVVKEKVDVSGKCGFFVTSPSPNEKVNFPLTIKGAVDNSSRQSKGCSWQMFEGQAGVADLYFKDANNKWQQLNTSKPVPVENWMSTSTVFSVVLNFSNEGINLPAGTSLKVVFTEDNASGMPPVDTFELPLIFSGSTVSSETMSLTLYVQDKEIAQKSDCGVTKKVIYQVPKTTAVADASLKILFGDELSQYGVYKSVSITNSVAKVMLVSDNMPSGFPITALSSCQISHLTSVLKDTLTQYSTIKSVELYSPRGKIEF
jgi:hypothetical protein